MVSNIAALYFGHIVSFETYFLSDKTKSSRSLLSINSYVPVHRMFLQALNLSSPLKKTKPDQSDQF